LGVELSLLDPEERRHYLNLILQAGLEEDFLEWLRQQGITHVVGRFDNIPLELIKAYAGERKLTAEGEEAERVQETREADERFIPAKARSRRF
jgi:hypothetical protein